MPPNEPDAQLRPFAPGDYPALQALLRRIDPGFSASVSDMRAHDLQRHDEPRGRVVLERRGALVAAADFELRHGPKRHFDLGLHVPDTEREQSDRLYRAALERLAPFDPAAICCYLREDRRWLLDELAWRGYRELERHYRSSLDVGAFDPQRLADLEDRFARAGVRLVRFADVAPDTRASLRRLYQLDIELIQDIPWAEPLDLWSFETWCDRFDSPAILHEGILLAEAAGGGWVGLTMLMASDLPGQLQTGLTGVLAPWRGRGIATALKLAAVDLALRRGAAEIITRNHSSNQAMLAINEWLGFVREPAFVTLQLALEPADRA